MKEWIIGPRQTSGSRSLTRSVNDIILRPSDSTGMILLSNVPGRPLLPSIIGTSGPYTSASMMPTAPLEPRNPTARFTATVDLPTPPLPDDTAIVCRTSGIKSGGRCGAAGPAAGGRAGALHRPPAAGRPHL